MSVGEAERCVVIDVTFGQTKQVSRWIRNAHPQNGNCLQCVYLHVQWNESMVIFILTIDFQRLQIRVHYFPFRDISMIDLIEAK